MTRVFVADLRAGEVAIRGDEHHYLMRVRRARVGDAVELVDGAGRRAAAVIEAIGADVTTVRAGEPEHVADAPPRIRALIPWIKGDRMELCIEKLVEVGCDDVVVWPAIRAVVQLLGARRDARVVKLAAAAAAAARQCGRATIPSVSAVASLSDAISISLTGGQRFVLVPGAERVAFPSDAVDIALASGPEGGLAPVELDALLAAGFAPMGLGPRVLRAETAPVVAVAVIRAASNT